MFIFGQRINPGFHGRQPALTDLADNDLKHHTDFRAVYATVLDKWLGADPSRILGAEFERVPFLQ
jgi:uncharacterized protein (DUF1501 family)